MSAAPPINPATARVVSHYGVRPSRRSGAPHFHAGLDVSTPRGRGEPIFAVDDGTVALVSHNESPAGMGGYGNAVVLRHPDGRTYTLYAHMDSIAVNQGQSVRAGQMVGRMGSTTNGQFSPMPGQDPAQWAAQARARGYRSPAMTPHLHFEVRQRADGSPFPGPYPQSAAQAQYNLDPMPWLRAKGIVFTSRGGVSIQPGSEAASSQASWQPLIAASTSMAGLGDLGQDKGSGALALPSGGAVASPIEPGKLVPGGYEPVTFERDVRFGFTPIEWGALGLGCVVLAGGGAYYAIKRSQATPNARRKRSEKEKKPRILCERCSVALRGQRRKWAERGHHAFCAKCEKEMTT